MVIEISQRRPAPECQRVVQETDRGCRPSVGDRLASRGNQGLKPQQVQFASRDPEEIARRLGDQPVFLVHRP
jgi:hypothetical protein